MPERSDVPQPPPDPADRQGASQDALEAALDYAGRAWSVIPLRPGEKRPLIPWLEFQHRHADESEIRGWFDRWPAANIGIVTGAVSGLVVIDIDPQHGGEESLAELIRGHGPPPETIEARTGGGGRHLYFTHPGGDMRNRAGLFRGIDLRGDGGMVVAPPSLHPSGRRYAWRPGADPKSRRLAALPAWFLAPAREKTGHPLAYWRDLVHVGVEEGVRNSTIASLTGHLLWHGIDPTVALDLMLCWNAMRCRPPLPDEEVARTVESITRLHMKETGF